MLYHFQHYQCHKPAGRLLTISAAGNLVGLPWSSPVSCRTTSPMAPGFESKHSKGQRDLREVPLQGTVPDSSGSQTAQKVLE